MDSLLVHLHDFGYHLATDEPDRVLGLILQNGNAHHEGLGDQWDSAKVYWADPSDEHLARLPRWLDFDGTRDQYLGGLPERIRDPQPPAAWHLDWERMSRPGNVATRPRVAFGWTAVGSTDERRAAGIPGPFARIPPRQVTVTAAARPPGATTALTSI